MPYQYEDGACVYHIERDWIGDTSKAVLYRFSDLTLTHIELQSSDEDVSQKYNRKGKV